MKRFHVHVSVGDLNQSIQFYTELFGSQPSVTCCSPQAA
jgi:catechol 2,3-dioxygenase-like lactoylglutathione lyase family enzyme